MCAWIEVHQSLPTHPKTIEAALLLDVSEPVVVGHLVCLWTWAVDAKPDGRLDLSKPRIIARAARWELEPGRFVDALVAVRFLDDDGAIHDWDDYTGRLMERRERVQVQTRERVRAYRERHRLSSRESGNAKSNALRNAPVTLGNAPTVPNPTVPNPPSTTPPLKGGPRDADAPAVLSPHQGVINSYLTAIGRDPTQAADYKRFLRTGAELSKQERSPEDVAGCTGYLLAADWRQRGGTVPTLENVRDYLPEWIKGGRPPRPAAQSSSNGRPPGGPRSASSRIDAVIERATSGRRDTDAERGRADAGLGHQEAGRGVPRLLP